MKVRIDDSPKGITSSSCVGSIATETKKPPWKQSRALLSSIASFDSMLIA